MAFAVIKTGGKQYLVEKGTVITIEKLKNVKEGETADFEVLLTDDGKKTEVGAPTVSGAKASGKVLAEGKGKKVTVVRYKQKSRYHKKKGHRQPFSKVQIESI